MIYEILLDGQTLYYPGDEECIVLDPEIDLKMNDAGTAKMSIPSVNPLYDTIKNRNSMLTVKKNGTEVFYGEVRGYSRDFDMARKLTAVGVLSFLNDSIQPQYNYGKITPLQFITALLNVHNQQMFSLSRKKIQVGTISVGNTSNNKVKITDNETTLEALKRNLIDVHGGVLRIRHSGNNLYLDYIALSEVGRNCQQSISLGENIMDYAEDFDAESVKTVIIPLGARIENPDVTTEEEFEKRVDIKTVNDNKDYILGNQTAIENYGYVWGTVTYDAIDNPSTLKTMGQTYLRETQFERSTFKLTAVDLSAVEADIDSMFFGDYVHVKADMFGMDTNLYIIEMTMKPENPEDERITLSGNLKTKKQSLTSRLVNATNDARQVSQAETQKIAQVIRNEIKNIIQRFEGQLGGYKLSEYDEDGLWLRDLYMDAPNKEDAESIMEISMNGIRFSTGGYAAADSGVWKSAWSIDGKFVSEEIFSDIIFANLLKVGTIEDADGNTSWNLGTGQFTSNNLTLLSPYFKVTPGARYVLQMGDIYQGWARYDNDGIMHGGYNNREHGTIDFSAITRDEDQTPSVERYGVQINGGYFGIHADKISVINNSSPTAHAYWAMTGSVTVGNVTMEFINGILVNSYSNS